jgi:hypothetical protein
MAKKKTAGTSPADTAAEAKTPAPRKRRTATPTTAAEMAVRSSNGNNGADATPDLVSAPDASTSHGPTYDQIAEAAYLRYLSRGGGDGLDFDDWVAAEQALKNR